MGDRAQVIIRHTNEATGEIEQIALYTHWMGAGLPEVVESVIVRNARMQDFEYLSRIMFCAMIPKTDWDKETGFGIGTKPHGDSRIMIMDLDHEEVHVLGYPWADATCHKVIPFINIRGGVSHLAW